MNSEEYCDAARAELEGARPDREATLQAELTAERNAHLETLKRLAETARDNAQLQFALEQSEAKFAELGSPQPPSEA